jgi:Stage II sporulation protein E (SpoIIE)
MTELYTDERIDNYLRKRLMPVEGAMPQIPGIEMCGNSVPAGTVGGDLFEYINFQQRYDIDARIDRALRLSKEFLEPLMPGAMPRNSVDDHIEWLRSKPDYFPTMEAQYRAARSSEQARVAETLPELYSTAGVLLVDAEGHGLISAKIASTVHDTFHAFMLSELDQHGRTTPELFENINLRLALSVTPRHALGTTDRENAREIATMLYGEVHPYGYFRFVNFGHPRPSYSPVNITSSWSWTKTGWCNSCHWASRSLRITPTGRSTSQCNSGPGRLTRPTWPKSH